MINNKKFYCDSHFHISEMNRKGILINNFLYDWQRSDGLYLIDIGITEENMEERIELAHLHNFLYLSCGIHPNNVTNNYLERLDIIENQLLIDKVVAVGETGLDYYWSTVERSLQKASFIGHIELAIKHKKPIIIHNRDASDDLISILKQYPSLNGVIHCFSSSLENAKILLDLGFYISFAGNITYKKNQNLLDSIKIIPIDRLLIETDSPYLSPQCVRGTINTPCNIRYTYAYISKILDISITDLQYFMQENIYNLFQLKNK